MFLNPTNPVGRPNRTPRRQFMAVHLGRLRRSNKRREPRRRSRPADESRGYNLKRVDVHATHLAVTAGEGDHSDHLLDVARAEFHGTAFPLATDLFITSPILLAANFNIAPRRCFTPSEFSPCFPESL